MRKKYSTAILLMAFLLLTIVTSNALGQDFTLKPKYEYSTPELRAAQRLYSTQKYAEALAAFEAIIQKAETSQNYEEVVYAMEKKALALRRLERFDQVIETMDQAISLAIEKLPKDHFLIAKMYYTRGTTDHSLRNYYSARQFLDTALVYYDNATSYDSAAYYRIVEYKYYTYEYSEGSSDTLVKYLDKLLELEWVRQKRSSRPDRILQLMQGYPTIYLQKGDFEQALAFAIRAYKYANENLDKVSNRYLAEALYDLTQTLYFRGDYEKAIEIGLKAMPIVESTPRESMPEYYSFNNLLGVVYSAVGEYNSALPYFQKAGKIPLNKGNVFDRRNRSAFYAQVIMNLGICYENLGESGKAEEYLKKSVILRKEIVSIPSPDFQNNFEFLGNFYFKNSLWQNALDSYDSALRNGLISYTAPVDSFPSGEGMTFSYQDLRTLERKTSSMKELALSKENSIDLLIAANTYAKELHGLLMESRDDFLATEGKLFLSEDFKSLYETGIDICFELYKLTNDVRYFEDALGFAKKSKGILFLEQSQEFELVNTNLLSQDVKELFFYSKSKVESLQKEFYGLIDNSATSDSVMMINDELLEARLQSENVKDSIEFLLSQYEKNKGGTFKKLLDEGEKLFKVSQGEALIEFFYGDRNIYVLARSSDSMSFQKVELTSNLEQSIQRFIGIVSKPPKVELINDQFLRFKEDSQSLYKTLIKPALDDLEGELNHLVIVPDELLSRLPFESLVVGDSESKGFHELDYLIKSYSIQYELSSVLYNSPLKKESASEGLLGIGFQQSDNTQTRSGYGNLPGTGREIRFLQSAFKGTYLLGDGGSKSDFLEKASNFDILHLAIHGKADSVNRYQSSLIFNGFGDNTLNTNDLYLAGLQARLAVLSACESGVGVINKGEGTFSIARGFAIVGVPSIVMSLWKVNDRVTADLVVKMYEGFINEGYTINNALRQAKLSYLSSSDEYFSHPYYWSAFQHLGQDLQLNRKKHNYRNVLGLSVAIIVLLLLLALYRNRKRAV